MERQEEQKRVRVQIGWLLMTPVPDVLFQEIRFGGNIYLSRLQIPSIILPPPPAKTTNRDVKEGSEVEKRKTH